MKKVIILISIFSLSLFATNSKTIDVNTPLTKAEQDMGNACIQAFNNFITDKNHPISKIEKAIKIKDRFFKMVDNKKETIAVQESLKVMNQLPVRKQFCVTAMLSKNLPKINQCVRELDLMDKEVDNQYSDTRKEVIYENLVIYYGNTLDYKQAEKLAYRTLSMYPDNVDTLKNMAILYTKSLNDRFKDEIEAGCYAFYLENRSKKLQGKKVNEFEECSGFDGKAKFDEISQIVLYGDLLQKKTGIDK